MDKKIFFSYGHDEYKDFVLKVQKYLENEEDFQVFVDSDKLRSGDDWEYKLEQAIKENSKMIFFITPHSARRPDGYCLNEISMALAHDIKVFPVMIEEHILPLSLIRKQFLDLQSCLKEGEDQSDGIFAEQMKYLVEALTSNNDLEHGDIQQKLINSLKPIDFQLDYAMHGRLIGREWVMNEVDNWIENKAESKVLWITAEAGYGKSAISAYLARHPKVMSVHFCNYNSPRTQDPRNVIKTLAYNLQAQQIEGYREEIEHIELENKTAFELFRDLIANPLSRVKKEGSIYLFVIDALDETLNDENMELIALLGSDEFRWGLPDFVKIIITSRPEPKIKQAISKFDPLELEAQRQENKDDCKDYIKARLNEFNKDKVEDNGKLVDIIMEKSSANMLYLTKFFDDDTLDLSQPDKFPKDLAEIYWRFFRRVTQDIEEYDEKLSPILELMLAYGESIPKLLLQDILGLNVKTLRRQLNMFGSILRENDGKLDFYHKSLRDWLIDEANEDYFVDMNEGKKKIDTFMRNLTRESYKNEYIEFHALNNKLIQNSYQSKKTLNKFFKLIKSKSKKKIISMLEYEAEYFTLYEQNRIAIELQEKIYLMLKKLTINNEKWAKKYSMILHNLAVNYRVTYRGNKEGFNLQIENLELCEYHYIKEPELWAGECIIALNDLATSYSGIKNHPKALTLGEKSLDICEKLYEENPDKWVTYYVLILNSVSIFLRKKKYKLDAISMAKKSLLICEELYNANPARWTAEYIKAIDTLAVSYFRLNSIKVNYKNEAFELLKINSKLCKTLYKDNENRWAEEYNMSLGSLANYYKIIDKQKKAIKLGEKSLAVRKKFYKVNPNKWKYKYLSGLKLLTGKSYFQVKKSDVRLKFLEELHKVQLDVYGKNSNYVKKTLLAIKVTKENCPCGSGKKYKKCCRKN